jgi:minimal PKS ketosynthase (KS/KS alpha)
MRELSDHAFTKRVVITGTGIISPGGCDRESCFDSLVARRSLVRRIDRFDPSAHGSQIAAQVECFEGHSLHPDRHVAFAIASTQQALCQAGLTHRPARARIGTAFATAIAGTERMEKSYRRNGGNAFDAFRFSTVSEVVARQFGLGGPNLSVTTGCTAGLDAIGIAFDQIRLGRADAMVVGAADSPIVPIVVASFDQIGALSRRNDRPEAASRPFDRDRDGFILGEGGAALVLESSDHSRQRGAAPLAEILGWNSVSSAFHMTSMRTNGADISRAINGALRVAGVAPESIDLLDLHATSTKINDRSEAAAVHRCFGPDGGKIAVMAQKSVLGHALGASNTIELVGCVEALRRGMVPPVANLDNLDPDCPVNAVRDVPLLGNFRHLVKVSSGFSGIHTALVLRRSEVA